jgi:hypothetical protein
MPTPSNLVHPRVRAVLEPFVRYRGDWIFHYPVYLNTFCFTYDLAALLSDGPVSVGANPLGGNFRRHDWSRGEGGLPEFTYRRDIEIFVAVDRMLKHAENMGHDIDRRRHRVLFTRYDVKRVFVRKRTGTSAGVRKCLLITDLPQNAEELLDEWKIKPPRGQLKKFRHLRLVDMRLSSKRELHDLFADDNKLYLFGAPMAYVLKQLAGNVPGAKYIELKAGMKPVDTFFVFRCNSGVDPQRLQKLRDAVDEYYRLIFGAKQPEVFLHPKVAWEYGRIASTMGQPHPFHEVQEPATAPTKKVMAGMNERYAKILLDHHRT